MKKYNLRPGKGPACPRGVHEPFGSETNACDCPWLVIESDNGVAMAFNRRELVNLIKEFDSGYFDPADYPLRAASMFVSPHVQALIDLAETDPLRAAMRLLSYGNFSQVTFDRARRCLSLQFGADDAPWWQIWLPEYDGDSADIQLDHTPGGDNPEPVWKMPATLDGAVVMGEKTKVRIREMVREITAGAEFQPYAPGEPLPELTTGEPAPKPKRQPRRKK